MNKISNKLILAFGALIVMLLVMVVLNQVISKQVTTTHEKLKAEVGPAVHVLNKFQAVNKELILLASNKVVTGNDEMITNRMKMITEVELPYFKTEVYLLRENLPSNDPKVKLSKNIIAQTNSIITIVKSINNLLLTKRDYNDSLKMMMALQKVNHELPGLSFQLENGIKALQMVYNGKFEIYQSELSDRLNNISNIILIAGLVSILFGLVIALQTIRSIIRPIKALETSAHQISKGDYDTRVLVKEKNELALLGNSFNVMAGSLKKSFSKISLKNKELEQFVYIASHDLQEPLRTVNSFTELLKKQYQGQLDELADKYLVFISEASTRMSQLVRGLLEYGRIGRNKEMTLVDCNVLAKTLRDDLATTIAETNTILEISELPKLQGYETELRLLFQNLISNAIKFQKQGQTPRIEINAQKQKGYWKFSFHDNAIGIKREHKERIFHIFQRLHSRSDYDGTGIGLAHCRKIVELHGGKIWVDSQPNKGSTFYFTIQN